MHSSSIPSSLFHNKSISLLSFFYISILQIKKIFLFLVSTAQEAVVGLLMKNPCHFWSFFYFAKQTLGGEINTTCKKVNSSPAEEVTSICYWSLPERADPEIKISSHYLPETNLSSSLTRSPDTLFWPLEEQSWWLQMFLLKSEEFVKSHYKYILVAIQDGWSICPEVQKNLYGLWKLTSPNFKLVCSSSDNSSAVCDEIDCKICRRLCGCIVCYKVHSVVALLLSGP